MLRRMPRGRNQMPYYGHCPENEMPHMQRGACFPDGYGKMDGPCGMNVSEFKSPMMNVDPQPPPSKKKRRASNAMAAASQPPPTPVMQDLLPPPPLAGFGETIVASNPFDDAPPTPSMSHLNAMNHVNKHMGVGPCMSPAAPIMSSMSPCHIVGSPMSCGPPVGSPIDCGPPMGSCSPMGGGGNNPNCGPGGSPHTSCNSRVSRSPLVCTPMSNNSVMSNSPMNVNSVLPMNRSPSLGSPLGSVMTSNVRGNSPLDCGLGINSVGSQKGSPMSVMNSHNMNSISCGSPMGSPSNVSLNNCGNSNMMGSPITSPLNNVPCSLSGGSDLGISLNGVMHRSPMNGPPNSMNASLMCNSSMKGPSPINAGPMNPQMAMSCNANSSLVNVGKNDMNMNELGLRENCGPPGHLSMKPNNGPIPGSCGIPVNNVSCTRQPDISGMQCGPMNSPHCNPMMSNQCGPPMSHGIPCIGGGINRPPQCGPNMGMGMGNPYDGMNPQQCRPNMNRSQFPRGMTNVHYGQPGNMNGPMNGPMNSPLNSPMNGPNMGNMCPTSEMGNISCGPNSGANGMHCIGDSPMSNSQCMSNINQCSAPNPMFGSQYSPFDVNVSRCSPNLHFNSNDMNVNGNFYRTSSSIAPSSSCVSNMHPSVVAASAVTVCTNSNDVLSVTDSIMSTGVTKNDNNTVDSDIASVVCSIASDNADDLNLIGDNLLRESKSEEQRNKPMKDFNSRMLLGDEGGELKDDSLDVKPTKLDLVDVKISDELKLGETKRESDLDKNESTSTSTSSLDSATTTNSTSTTTALTTSSCATTTSTAATSIATTSVTTSSAENNAANDDGDSASAAISGKSNENNDNDDEYVFKSTNSEAHSNASVHSNAQESGDNTHEENVCEDKIQEEPEEKQLESSFNDDEEKSRDEKNDSSNDVLGSVKSVDESASDKDCKGTVVKLENDDFYESNLKSKSDCSVGNGLRGNGGGFNSGGIIAGPPSNFNMPNANDVPNMMNNVPPGMNDSLCGSPMLPSMNRSPMPNALNHSMNYPNRQIGKVYPVHKSKIFNPQNPNAPPTYSCGNCHKEVNDNDQAVLCESGCHFWYHRTCSGLMETAYHLLTNEIYAEWACDRCLSTKTIPLVKYKP